MPRVETRTPEQHASYVIRGKRAKTLRALAGLSRYDFERETGIPAGTLQNWENATRNGMTEEGVRKLVKAYTQLGITVTYEWLMFGIGPSPVPQEVPELQPINALADDNKAQIQKEINFFLDQHKHAVTLTITDDSMAPFFTTGDIVAGVRRFKQDIKNVIGHDCIIVTKEGYLLLRHLKASDLVGHYTLICHNPHTTADYPILKDIAIVSAAPVIWIRRTKP